MKKIYLTLLAFVSVLLIGSLCSCELPFGGPKYTYTDLGESYELTNLGDSTETEIVIPAKYKGKPVTSIGAQAFYRQDYYYTQDGIEEIPQITSITLPDSITNIGNKAFAESDQLTTLVIPAGVTNIGDSAFLNCLKLESVNIPDGITEIKPYTFAGCWNLASINVPSSVTTIGDYAFANCNALESFTFDANITSVGNYAFSQCTSFTEITVPNTVTTLGEYVFSDTTEELVVSVSYDSEPQEGWSEKWYYGMKGKAINTSEVYFNTVVAANIEKAAEIQAQIDSNTARYKALGDEMTALNEASKPYQASGNSTMIKYYRDEINARKQQRSNIVDTINELREELKKYPTTNQIN